MTTLNYIGHSAFTVNHGDKVIAVDPFISGNPVAKITPDEISPDLILLTHGHNDHVGDAVELSKRTGAPVVTGVELANVLAEKGATTVGMNFGGTYSFDGGSAKMVPAWHTSTWTDENGNATAQGVPAGFVVKLGDGQDRKTIYFAGDTCLFMDMQLIGDEELDVAVIPIGDHYTMGPDDAVKAVKYLRPKTVVPCHCNTFPLIEQDCETFKSKVERQTQAKCQVLDPGDRWDVEQPE
jgi:L-ascorbate metabolism protein UlaG (beta-lactamase superfamily)